MRGAWWHTEATTDALAEGRKAQVSKVSPKGAWNVPPWLSVLFLFSDTGKFLPP